MRSFRRALTEVRRHLPALAGFQVLFSVLSAVVLAPFGAWVLTRLIASTGGPAVSNLELASFLLSPTGAVAILLPGAVSLATLLAQQAGITLIATSTPRGPRLGATGAFLRTARCVPALLLLGLLKLGGFLATAVPFAAAAGAAYFAVLSEHDINYYLATTPPRFWAVVAVVAVLALAWATLAWVLFLRWSFALPMLLFERRRPIDALRQSWRAVRGARPPIGRRLAGWWVLVLTTGAVLELLFGFAAEAVLVVVGNGLGAVIPAVASLLALDLVLTAATALVAFAVHCILIEDAYRAACAAVADADADLPGAGQSDPDDSPAHPAIGRLLWIGAAALVLLAAVSSHQILAELEIEDQVAVTAHRGASRGAPENSLSAIRLAIEQGADFAEIDVQETRDGVVVLLHDSDLMRVASLRKSIWEVDYAEIEGLDCGSWFAPEFRGERIPTLTQAMDLARGKIELNIELKYNGHDQKLAERVVQLVEAGDFAARCVITSLTYEGLLEVKRRDGRLRTGFIVGRALGDPARLDVDFLSVETSLATTDLVERMRALGKGVHVWTVNDPQQMAVLIDRRVENIITDVPDVLVAVLRQLAGLSSAERLLLAFRNAVFG